MLDDIFKNRVLSEKKLLEYGFIKKDGCYRYITKLESGFTLNVSVLKTGEVKEKVFDACGEQYVLYRTDASGSFVGRVRNDVFRELTNISENCFITKIYNTANALFIIDYAKEKYFCKPEYLWEKFPEYCVLRRKDNGKWFAVLMKIKKKKLTGTGEEECEVVNLKAEPGKLPLIIDKKLFFPGWHMNKKYWYTFVLNNDFPKEELKDLLADSYELAK